MTRKKVKLAFIENDSSRKATYKKRKRGILKKAEELATLCGVSVGVIINSRYDLSPVVWPSGVEWDKVMSQWEGLSEIDRSKKMLNQVTYLGERIAKTVETRKKLTNENEELKMKGIMFDCISGKISPYDIEKNDLVGVGNVIHQYQKILNRRNEILSNNDGASSSSVHDDATTSVAMPTFEMGSSSTAFFDLIRQQEIPNNMNQSVMGLDQSQREW